jgi:transposase-like protein
MLDERGVDIGGDTIDFYLSVTRNTKAANRFLGKALKGLKDWQKPLKIDTDKAPTYGPAIPAEAGRQARQRTDCLFNRGMDSATPNTHSKIDVYQSYRPDFLAKAQFGKTSTGDLYLTSIAHMRPYKVDRHFRSL